MINVLSAVSAAICFFCLILGAYIIRIDPKKRLHQLCFFAMISVAFLNAVGTVGFSVSAKADFVVLFKIGCVGVLVIFPLMVHLTMEIINIGSKIKYPLLVVFYLVCLFFIYNNVDLRVTYRDFERIDGFWRFIKAGNTALNLTFTLFSLSCFALCFFLLIRWRIKSNLKREKKQSSVLIVSAFLLFACLFAEQVILRFFVEYDFGLSIIYFSVWPAGVGLAVLKYRFLGPARERVFTEVLENIAEPIIVLDDKLAVVTSNAPAAEYRADRKAGVGELIPEFDSVRGKVRQILVESLADFSATLAFRKKDDSLEQMAVRFSAIRDKFGDLTGVLLIAARVRGLNDFLNEHRLSGRELTVLKLLVTGVSCREISAKLSLAESTIKTHVEHIYQKTGVKNKMELSHLLRTSGVFL